MPVDQTRPIRLAVLLSGGGTTLLNLHEKINAGELNAEISLVIASRECKGVGRSEALGYTPIIARRKQFASDEEYSDHLFSQCEQAHVDLVVLAGFLSRLVVAQNYIQRVMNIHPSLIPAFCGQGMYGHHVHEAVIARGCKVSGCTVHFCDNEYDHGPIVIQQSVDVLDNDNSETLAARVFDAECEVYPRAIQFFAEGRLSIKGRRVKIDS